MTNCPRCGAENKPGRPSCWKCWSPLPIEPLAAPVVDEPVNESVNEVPPSEFVDEVVAMPLVEPAHEEMPLPTLEVVTEPAASPVETPDDVPVITMPQPDEQPKASMRGSRSFAFVAPPPDAKPSRHALLVSILTIACMLALAASLAWYFFQPEKQKVTSPTDAARDYLTALTTYDGGSQQQLATEDSKGTMLPSWLVVVSGHEIGNVEASGDTAKVMVQIVLAPAPNSQLSLDLTVRKALARTYTIPLRLMQEQGSWKIDQQSFVDVLQSTLTAENANVKFPEWHE